MSWRRPDSYISIPSHCLWLYFHIKLLSYAFLNVAKFRYLFTSVTEAKYMTSVHISKDVSILYSSFCCVHCQPVFIC